MASIDPEILRLLVEDEVAGKVFDVIASKGEVEPIVKLDAGIIYMDFSNIDNWVRVIEELLRDGLIDRRIMGRIIRCPSCRSTHVKTLYKCVYCNSFNVVKTDIINHTICGYTSTRLRFEKYGELVCPNCNMRLRTPGIDYIIIGTVFECLDCKRRMDRPNIEHECIDCGTNFTYKEAIYDPIYAYALSELGRQIVSKGLVMRLPIVRTLREMGYAVEEDSHVVGMSGIKHRFDIVAKRDGEVIAIDVLAQEENVLPELLSMMSKVMDARVDEYIIVMRRAPVEARRISEAHQVKLLEAETASEISLKLREFLTPVEEVEEKGVI
mgnify:CR=1 FL=1